MGELRILGSLGNHPLNHLLALKHQQILNWSSCKNGYLIPPKALVVNGLNEPQGILNVIAQGFIENVIHPLIVIAILVRLPWRLGLPFRHPCCRFDARSLLRHARWGALSCSPVLIQLLLQRS